MKIIADTHFFHHNIIKYANRPFKNITEMNDFIIEQWNITVAPKEEILHLGDFAYGKEANKQNVKKIVQQLNGRKTLLLGNNDKKWGRKKITPQFWIDVGFEEVIDTPIVFNYNKDFKVVLTHFPVLTCEYYDLDGDREVVNIHGHTHDKCVYNVGHICACVELTGYRPTNVTDMVAKYCTLMGYH